MIIGLALAASAACRTNGDARMSRNPLLPPGTPIDLIRISEAVWERERGGGVTALSPGERVFLCIWNLEAEVNNGGFHQFFINSSGDNAKDTPAALREIGAAQAAALVEAANAVFGPSGPPVDRDRRIGEVERLGEPAIEAWHALDTRFYEYPDHLEGLLTAFVERNRDQFYEAK